MRRSDAAAYELAERSIQLNPANPLGWGCLGISEKLSRKVRRRHAAYVACTRHCRTCTVSISARLLQLHCERGGRRRRPRDPACGSMSCPGADLRAAASISGGPATPTRRPRALVRDDGEASANEPDFTFDRLRDKAYPVAGLHRTADHCVPAKAADLGAAGHRLDHRPCSPFGRSATLDAPSTDSSGRPASLRLRSHR